MANLRELMLDYWRAQALIIIGWGALVFLMVKLKADAYSVESMSMFALMVAEVMMLVTLFKKHGFLRWLDELDGDTE